MAKFDSDAFPDLLTLNEGSVWLFKNKVRENIEVRRKEQLSPDHQSEETLDDWPRQVLYAPPKHSKVIDFVVSDLNHDGFQDLLMVIEHKNGQDDVLAAYFASDMSYELSEIWFENTGIAQVLGFYDLTNTGVSSVIYISKDRYLAAVENRDPIYEAVYLLPQPLTTQERLTHCYFLSLRDHKTLDIVFLEEDVLNVVHFFNGSWSQTQLLSQVTDMSMSQVTRSTSQDIVYITGDQVRWLAEMPVGESVEKFVYTWERSKGQVAGYMDFPVAVEDPRPWTKVVTAVNFS